MRTLFAAIALVVLVLCCVPSAATEVVVASETRPEILDTITLPADVDALTVSPDGRRLAYAVTLPGPKGLSEVVQTVGPETTRTVTVRGLVRDLLFLADGRLLGLQYRAAKKWEGDTYLFSWTPDAPKVERVMRVPPSSSDLDHWPAGGGIVLACRNEIRTLLEPDLRTGSVFMVPGANLAVTTLGASSYLWVGQEDGLFLVDLSMPSGREPMTILARQPVSAPAVELADYPDGDTALARLADGRLYRASLDPPGFTAHGRADLIVGLAKSATGPRGAPAPPPAPAPAAEPAPAAVAEVPVAEPPSEPKPEPAPVVVAEVHAEEPPSQPDPEPEAEPEPEPAPLVVAEVLVEEPPSEPKPEPAPADRPVYQLYGRISGSVDLVREIVLLGPDNILREATRVRVDDRGRWGVERLEPGRYRIQLDGGGDRVLVADPRLVLVDVGADSTEAPEIRVLRSF